MNRFLFLFACVALLLINSISSSAQTSSPDGKGHFEFSLQNNFLFGTNNLMGYAGVSAAWAFKSNDKVLLDYAAGESLIGAYNKTQVLSLSYAHESAFSETYGIQFGVGLGTIYDFKNDGGYEYGFIGAIDMQHRIYFSQDSFVGFDARAYLGKDFRQGSCIGVVYGYRF